MLYSNIYAIIVAAGKGTRLGGPIPKQLLRYAESTVLEHTARVFASHERVNAVIIVGPSDGRLTEHYEEIISSCKSRYVAPRYVTVPGGAERSDSVVSGLREAERIAKEQGVDPAEVMVMIHDAARPGIDHAVIDRNIEAMEDCRAVVTCVPSVDSVRVISEQTFLNSEGKYPIMESNVLERKLVYNVQTPQSFCLSDIIAAYVKAEVDGYVGTDDASVADYAGISPAIVLGSPQNYKITTAKDVPMETRVGTGFDVHRLVPDRALTLCGTPVPYEKGLLGHSDADVATHALMDALLGAAGQRDIGYHFPDSDEKYKGADSLKLLAEVKRIIGDVKINNVDITIIAERPKLAAYNSQMRENIARTLEIPTSAVNIKATTTEGLGFTGRGEGIAALATCAIEGSF